MKPGKSVVCAAGTLRGGDLVPAELRSAMLAAGSAEWK